MTHVGDGTSPSLGMRLLLALAAVCLLLPGTAFAGPGLVLDAPVDGPPVRGFDGGTSRYSAGHRGVDLRAATGGPVRAAAAGRVHFAGVVAGRPSVSVDHGGVRTTYTPVRATVSPGQAVSAGDVLGFVVGGHCDGQPCLHWGLTDGTDYHDPMAYLAQRRVRLLPRGSQPSARAPLPAAEIPGPGGRPPVEGRLSSPFGMRVHPVTGVLKLHDGTDFAAPCGTPVRVPWAGEVIRADVSRGYGYRVHVRHDDSLVTAYAHLPRFEVRVGQRLSAGARVGEVGSTGYSTGCHLHWMAWRDDGVVDPMAVLG
ncbi:Murein DD-endopeptidase MepM and murein hydrolase activator NlpD, contain LysM domain [Tessaracoccus oleiagri]|uniref:Murein DD-endopeptidase MepM and murein hydrolase activator NlpD, contain LysM domain n=2 Tax=Tessaracoccus oleiagri TaxID=686624 RepID=A0A1G9LNW9_9ACTN|nr:Murein DD-endopeptidase MepM and murein hydrolase activator NlpD, contain LysM domain [Tessaracoccus oleiagri]